MLSNNLTNPFLDYLLWSTLHCIILSTVPVCSSCEASLPRPGLCYRRRALQIVPHSFTALEMEPVFYCSKQHKKRDLLAYLKYIVEVLSLYKLYFFELRAYRHHKVHFHLVIFKVVPTFYYKSQNDLRRVGGGVGWRCLVSQ